MKPTVLVPYDFSDNSLEALTWAADLQNTLKDKAPIHLVHFISSSPSHDPMSIMQVLLPAPEEIATLQDALRETVAKVGAWAEIDVLVRPLSIGDAVVIHATELHIDLVVMGTHGRTGVKRMLLGSVANHVVSHAPCPVVTIRSRARADAH